jgi:trimeric autotransporter adhesin
MQNEHHTISCLTRDLICRIPATCREGRYSRLLPALLLATAYASAASTCPMTQTGAPDDPYQVATYGELDSIGTFCDLSASFRLVADIDASPSDTENHAWGFHPIGNATTPFVGTFHGGGHVIKHLHIADSTSNDVGLFGVLQSATIDSIDLDGADVNGDAVSDSGRIGILAGVSSSSTILRCKVTAGIVSGLRKYASVGGLVGQNLGTIEGCRIQVSVKGGGYGAVGGVAGDNRENIRSSRAWGSISGSDSATIGGVAGISKGPLVHDTADAEVSGDGGWEFVGGIVGVLDDSLRDCRATGAVSAKSDQGAIGGAVGYLDTSGSVTRVVATGSVTGSNSGESVGGLAGYIVDSAGAISDCWASGEVNGNTSSNVGGLVGMLGFGDVLVASRATGSVSGLTGSNIGGLVGQNNGSVNRCYATGKVVGSGSGVGVGGVVGWNLNGYLTNSYSTGFVLGGGVASGESIWVGGVAGGNNASMKNVYFAGRIDSISGGGTIYIGGVAGQSAPGVGTTPEVTNAYWAMRTSGQNLGLGAGSNPGSLDTAIAFTTDQMRSSANFSGFLFDPDTGWKITEHRSYPALSGLANAPFAFGDSLLVDSTGLVPTRLLVNDVDADRATPTFVARVDSVFSGDLITFAASAPGTLDTLLYRAGEVVSTGDTLWGGAATAVVELVSFHFVPGTDSVHTYGDGAFTLTASVAPSFPVTYASQDAAVAIVSGDQVQPLRAGSTILTASIGDLTSTGTLRVAPKRLTITDALAQDKVYDGSATATVTGQTLAGIVSGDEVSLSLGSATFSDKNVGTAKPVTVAGASLTGTKAGNYSVEIPSGLTAKIVPDTIHVTALADSVEVQQPDPVFGYTHTSLIGTDALSGALSRTDLSNHNVATYRITQGSLTAGANYAIIFTDAPYKILPRPSDALVVRTGRQGISHEPSIDMGRAFAKPVTGTGRGELGSRAVPEGDDVLTVNLLLPSPGEVSVSIYDNLGMPVISFDRRLGSGDLNTLRRTADGRRILPVSWNLRSGNGIAVPTGVYLWKIDIQTDDGQKLQTVKKLGVQAAR